MHASVHDFFNNHTTKEMFNLKDILEVGSYDVNGSVRPYVESHQPKSYVGTDFMDGPRVDRVVNAEKLVDEFGEDSFDTVISTEMLEHAENWRECVNQMKAVTRNLLIITTRGPGFPLHSYPDDWWRYTTDDFKAIFADFDIKVLIPDSDPNSPGVFFIGAKTSRDPVDLSKIELTPAPKQ